MIDCLTLVNKKHNYIRELAYTVNEFDFSLLKISHDNTTKKGYLNEIICTFDIESSTVKDKISRKENVETYSGFMYHFQFCINGYVIFGRTWEEFKLFINKMIKELDLDDKHKIVCYVHYLSYEFNFIYDFLDITDIFATGKRKVLKCVGNGCIEFRCSYLLSNMSLAKFIENTPDTTHLKSYGDLDYGIVRTPKTPLTMKEYGYCYNDVYGLYECIREKLKYDDYDSIPLTSTGYIRREIRLIFRKDKSNRKTFRKMRLDKETYLLCKECFRGGNTASNRLMADMIISNVSSYDRSSSYPHVMVASNQFPMGNFMQAVIENEDDLTYYNGKFATIGRYSFKNIRLKKDIAIPYIPFSKCNELHSHDTYNGRVMKAKILSISLTNIDKDIIDKQYDYDDITVTDFYFARRGMLPKCFRDYILEMYKQKSQLKVMIDKETNQEKKDNLKYEYAKFKNKINALFGMCVTDVVHNEITYNSEDGWNEKEPQDIQKELDSYYDNYNSFLSYQWGVFVTAIARYELQRGIDITNIDNVYNDTDSCKFVGNYDEDFDNLNETIRKEAKENNAEISVNVDGKEFTLGVWEKENPYKEFITLGAKKYAYRYMNDKLGITVSGLNKIQGAKELEKKGGLEYFRDGEIFINSGRTCSYFNIEKPHKIKINGDTFTNASNVAVINVTYTLGMTDTMKSIIYTLQNREYMLE